MKMPNQATIASHYLHSWCQSYPSFNVFQAATLALHRVFCFSDRCTDVLTPRLKIMTTYSAVAWWVNKQTVLYIHMNLPKAPSGIKNAPTQPPIRIKYFRPQNPFWMPALGSFDDLTPIIMVANSKKNRVTMKHILQVNEARLKEVGRIIDKVLTCKRPSIPQHRRNQFDSLIRCR